MLEQYLHDKLDMINSLLVFSVLFIGQAVNSISVVPELNERISLESTFNVPLRVNDGLQVLPLADRGVDIPIYSFEVPSEYVTDLSEKPISTKTVKFYITPREPSYKTLSQLFKMELAGFSQRVLSRTTKIVKTENPFYLKTRPDNSVLKRGLLISNYLKATIDKTRFELTDLLTEKEGFSLRINDISYSFLVRDYFPRFSKLDKEQRLIPLVALFGFKETAKAEPHLMINNMAQEYAKKSGLSYHDWLLTEYAVNFGKYIAELNSAGLMPLAHLQNTLAIVNDTTGKIIKFVGRDWGDSLVFSFIPEGFNVLNSQQTSLLKKSDYQLYSYFSGGERYNISEPGAFFSGYVFQSLHLLFDLNVRAQYELALNTFGHFLDGYLENLCKLLKIDKSKRNWSDLFKLKDMLKGSYSDLVSYYRDEKKSNIPMIEMLSANIFTNIFDSLQREIGHKYISKINSDYKYQKMLKQKWENLSESSFVSFTTYSSKKNISRILDSEGILVEDSQIGLILFKKNYSPENPYTLVGILHFPAKRSCSQHYN